MDPKLPTNVRKSNLRAPAIQNRFRKLTLNMPKSYPNPATTLRTFSQSKSKDDTNLGPSVSKNKPNTVTNKIMLSTSSDNTSELQTNLVNVETEPFAEPLQLSDTVELQTNVVNVETESFTEPLQLSDTEEGPHNGSHVSNNENLVTKVTNVGVCSRVSQDLFSQSYQSSDFYLPPNKVVSNMDQSIDSISQRFLNINMADGQIGNSPAETLTQTTDHADNIADLLVHPLISESDGKLKRIGDDLQNMSPITLSSDDNENVIDGNDSFVTMDSEGDGDDDSCIEVSSSDGEVEQAASKDVSILNSREVEISKTVEKELNEFFDNIPNLIHEQNYEKTVDLEEPNETHESSEAQESNTDNVFNNSAIESSRKEENDNSGLTSDSSDFVDSRNKRKTIKETMEKCSSELVKSSQISELKTTESQPTVFTINSPRIAISATVNINIKLSVSSSSESDTDSSDEVDSSQKDSSNSTSSKATTSEVLNSQDAGEDQFKKASTRTHTSLSNSLGSESGDKRHSSKDNGETPNNEHDNKEIGQLEQSSQLFSDESIPKSIKNVTQESTAQSNNAIVDASPKSSPIPKPVQKVDQECEIDDLPDITDRGQAILTQLYGNDWKTPQMIRKCKSVTKKSFTCMPKLNTSGFNLFQRDIIPDLESTRITPTQGQLQVTPEPNVSNDNREISCRILRTGRKVPLNRILDNSSDEDEPANEDDFSDDSFKLRQSDRDDSDSSCDDKIPTVSKTKKKNNLVFLDLTLQEIIEDEDHGNPDASVEVLEEISEKFMKSLECQTPIDTPLPTKKNISSIRSKRKLFTPNYDNETPFEDDKTPTNEPTNTYVKLKTPIPTYLIPAQFRGKGLGGVKEIDEVETTPTAKKLPTPTSISRKPHKTPTVSLPASSRTCGFLESLDATIIPDKYCHPEALKFRKNFNQSRKELVNQLMRIYNKHVFDNKLLHLNVTWNKSLRRTAGLCKYRRRGANRICNVELSDKILTEPNRVRDTLIHELCHAATWLFDGESGHGTCWKMWTKKANTKLPELPAITRCHNYEIQYKYTYKCSICGLKSQAHSKSKKVENIRCASCHGGIEVFLNQRDKDGQVTLVPPKQPSGFAKFVKDFYKQHKASGSTHADVMRILSSNFAKLTAEEKFNYNK